jgi:Undecaprenyl-phosphate glucose phosphotransferase
MLKTDLSSQDGFSLAEAHCALSEHKKICPYNHVAALVVLDAVAIAIVGIVATWFIGFARDSAMELQQWQIFAMTFAILLQFNTAKAVGAYDVDKAFDLTPSVKASICAQVTTFAMLAVAAAAAKQAGHYSRLWFFTWALGSVLSAQALRAFLAKRFYNRIDAGHHMSRAMSIGVGGAPIERDDIEFATQKKVRVIVERRLQSHHDLAALSKTISERQIDCLFVSGPWEAIPEIASALSSLKHLSVRILILPREKALSTILDASLFDGDRLALCVSNQSIAGWGLWLKRVEDIFIAGVALALLTPLFILVSLAIKLESPGPVFFRQTRVGFNGERFQLWKFRSMYVEATDPHAQIQTAKGDKRVTRVGRLIRRLSIDELPQLLNVIEGDMSIVGPRPHALATKAENLQLEDAFDDYAARHRVKPGITGLAQVSGFRGELTSLEKLRRRIDYDLDYIKHWSLWLDLQIITKTAVIVLWDKNAY